MDEKSLHAASHHADWHASRTRRWGLHINALELPPRFLLSLPQRLYHEDEARGEERGDGRQHREHEWKVERRIQGALDEKGLGHTASRDRRGPANNLSKKRRPSRFEDPKDGEHLVVRHQHLECHARGVLWIDRVEAHDANVVDDRKEGYAEESQREGNGDGDVKALAA